MASCESKVKEFQHDTRTRYHAQIDKTITIRKADRLRDEEFFYQWMQQKHIAPFWKLNVSREEFTTYLDRSFGATDRDHFWIECNGESVSYMMTYQVKNDLIHQYYPYQETDLGVHIVIGPRTYLAKKYIVPMAHQLIEYCFAYYPHVDRFIVEPDVRNRIIIPALLEVGFQSFGRIHLPHKIAELLICDRIKYRAKYNG
ncbi:GNAT family N-acetyltransferase [Thermoactinomyces sp. DSM 45892]|uniref:GNAT family N-acetyltransferase n=1 Tax=Thermoactinomyces sp. DSM 45892 TaxID=1882753 RepID=UPI000896B127|nr:GNAT family N-acetyltransferase [Thermoactinomyces sp. DSM 45892]SDY01861.1 Protein N-acetyltransferase, RimJ/RimL family [Thermoactinomyces sp. DSM 45892]